MTLSVVMDFDKNGNILGYEIVNGVIKSAEWHEFSIKRVVDAFSQYGFKNIGITESPVKGGSGNTEFLACFRA